MSTSTTLMSDTQPFVDQEAARPHHLPHPPNVLARLHALLPPSQNASAHPPTPLSRNPSTASRPLTPRKASVNPPRPLKVRIMTWNMHESLPKGHLEELLGAVPSYTPQDPPGAFPAFPADENHPYHIVVVAGQECPSLSGIPMGLGAGLKLKDKDKEKEKDIHEPIQEIITNHPPSGWTSILEDWYCNGSGSGFNSAAPPAHSLDSSPLLDVVKVPPRSLSAGDIHSRGQARKPRKGLYELAAKERMMGIYLAVYVHRDIKSLVRGTSKSSVAAGLIGGRVGNKGGVGISLNLDGKTFLFINAHLAAHGEKVHNRLANFAKIKAELELDAFLKSDDPRIMKEDLTDKFDFTYIFGDLNFRLDLTRLHADWLISRREYAQALAFDQLRNIMQNGHAFDGFREGTIDFPPTFKYDVLRTLRKSRTKLAPPLPTSPAIGNRAEVQQLSEVQEKEGVEEAQDKGDDDDDDEDEDAAEADPDAETASVASSSLHSRRTTDVDDDEDTQSQPLHDSRPSYGATNLTHRLSIRAAAHKAKSKWMALVSPSTGSFPKIISPPRASEESYFPDNHTLEAPRPPAIAVNYISHSADNIRPKRMSRLPSLRRGLSTKSSRRSTDDGGEDHDRGVYDSSAKQRVPSWCDRILWKSTLLPDPEAEDEPLTTNSTRSRVTNFFAQAFKPRSSRRSSVGSIASTMSTNETISSSTDHHDPRSSSPTGDPEEIPDRSFAITRFFHQDAPLKKKLQHSQSIDILPVTERTSVGRTPSQGRAASRKPMMHAKTAPPHLALGLPSSQSIDDSVSHSPPLPAKGVVASTTGLGRRFFPFFYRDPAQPPLEPEPASAPESPIHRKGDVICLGYHTLDDRGMRRLEGRSDHRPVIGSYTLYV
ncbi:hypothetical protein JAAARDRAFT_79029 [Jaapia argillacea MUCL 33604]|uniref:Inositol polyphosphate-related phosphatase domain-containing protein n=1 Tax=Jaapia argillacea MUCL 33604 TaxID=933084 RepID=A0A067PTU0_9AGAM|nr:hypothetical protein JAAARDRAFT_79029 [Jaapia argillacea MUCL 33604]